MAIDVVIPKLGMTMKEGTIEEWTVADGAPVERDDVVLILITDKITTDVTAEAAGVLRHRAAAGETHPVSTVIGVILGEGEVMAEPAVGPVTSPPPATVVDGHAAGNGSTLGAAGKRATHDGRLVASPYARRIARDRGVDLSSVQGTGPGGRIVAADVAADVAACPDSSRPVQATPVARRLAEQLGVALMGLPGSGPGGRITKEDVEVAARLVTSSGAAPSAERRPSVGAAPERLSAIPMRGMRKVIADRMHASLREMAQLTLGMEVELTEAVALRRQLIEAWEPVGVRPSLSDLVCRAAVLALADHPMLNASIEEQLIRLHPDVHLGLAVAIDDGLLVPVVAQADRLPLKELASETARLADASKTGTIGVDELEGATFTVTALGSSGVDFFTPVINPPNVAILGVGRLHDGVRWDGDVPRRRQVMTLSLTIDHRAVDGAPGAAFLGAVRALLESPHRLLS